MLARWFAVWHVVVSFAAIVVAQTYVGFDNDLPGQTPEVLDPTATLTNVWEWSEDKYGPDLWPTQVRFSVKSKHVGVAFKQGYFRLYKSIKSGIDDYIAEVDLHQGNEYWLQNGEAYISDDHGLTSFAFDPDFPDVPLVYLYYTVNPDAKPQPRWPQNEYFASRPDKWGIFYSCPDLGMGSPDGPGNWGPTGIGDKGGQICEHFGRLARFTVDLGGNTIVRDGNILTSLCGGSSTHGVGNLQFMIDGRLSLTAGDHALYTVVDEGKPFDDACFDPPLGYPQGSWRSMREDNEFFMYGKIIAISLEDARTGVNIEYTGKYETLAKGLRNPFRHHILDDYTMYVGDVGIGMGQRTERLYRFDNVGQGDPLQNGGWPCLEGVRPYPFQPPEDLDRNAYIAASKADADYFAANPNIAVCDGVHTAVSQGKTALGADPNWVPPFYEYRTQQNDPRVNPYQCSIFKGSVTGILLNTGNGLGKKYNGALFFTDHTQMCTWYWPVDELPPVDFWPENGVIGLSNEEVQNLLPDISPHLLLRYIGFVDLTIDPHTGQMYMASAKSPISRIVRMEIECIDDDCTPPPTPEPPEPPVLPDSPVVDICHDPYNPPELEWTQAEDGVYETTVTMGVGQYETEHGTVRTRVYNGALPGPVMRLKACEIYRVTLKNEMEEWSDFFPPKSEILNTHKDPHITNLHLHGLHISSEAPGDNQLVAVLPGEEYVYTYVVPCDHAAGTHWYHAHHHGSVTLHAGGGAAALLIIDDALHEGGIESGMPTQIANLPTAYLFAQEISPELLNVVAGDSADPVWETSAEGTFFLVNGCDSKLNLPIQPGVWTRVNILFQGNALNAVFNLFGNNPDHGCDIGVLAKDGVYLETVPRMLDPNYPGLHLTVSGRVDVAIKCPATGAAYNFDIKILRNNDEYTVGKLQVQGGDGENDGALPEWKPCRPYYLMDLFDLPDNVTPVTESVVIREGINGASFDPFVYFRDDYQEGQVIEWAISHTDVHPLHTHVHHMQYQQDPANLAETPGFNRKGDWVDTVSVPSGVGLIRAVLDRYSGSAFMHCHVYTHADKGMATWFLVSGGHGPLSTPAVLKHGTCPLPSHKPYNGTPLTLPGVIGPFRFDEGGLNVGYYVSTMPDMAVPPTLTNGVKYTSHAMNDARRAAAVPVYKSTDTFGSEYDVDRLKAGDWLSYTVNIQAPGAYQTAVRATWDSESDISLGFKLNDADCNSAEGIIGKIEAQGADGGGYKSLVSSGTSNFAVSGQNNLVICILKGTGIRLSSISILIPGGSYVDPDGNVHTTAPYLDVPVPIPGTLVAEYHDYGGSSSSSIRRRTEIMEFGRRLGYALEPGKLEWVSYTVNIEDAGSYTVGLYMYASADAAKASQGIQAHFVIDTDDCTADPAWMLNDDLLGGIGASPETPGLYVTPQEFTVSSNSIGVHVLTCCFDNIPDDMIIDQFLVSLGGLPTPKPYSGTPVLVPGVIQAAEYDNVPVRYWGEGIAWHNIRGESTEIFPSPEISVDITPGQPIGWLQNIVTSEWLSYTVQFTVAGTHHVVLSMAGLPEPFHFAYSINLDSKDCNNKAAQLFEHQVENFVVGGGLQQFARFPAANSFTVTDEMINGPHQLTLCFLSAPPSVALQIQYLDILPGPTPGPQVRSCYIDTCNQIPTLRMENYDNGGSSVAFYNIDDGAFDGVRAVRFDGPEIVYNGEAAVLTHVISSEWLSFTVTWNNVPGTYGASINLNRDAPAVEGDLGLAVHLALNSVDCKNDDATFMWYDDQDWQDGAVDFNGFITVTEPFFQPYITVCFDRVPNGGIIVDSVQWNTL